MLTKEFMREIHQNQDYDPERRHSPESEEHFFFRRMRRILANKFGPEKAEEMREEWRRLYLSEELAILALCVDRCPAELRLLLDKCTSKEIGGVNFILDHELNHKQGTFNQKAMLILVSVLGLEEANKKVRVLNPQYQTREATILTVCLVECPAEFKIAYIDEHGLRRNWG